MSKSAKLKSRVFKTLWFGKAAKKARINDLALCVCIRQAEQGLLEDLGGGVFKKRLNDNMQRAIILAKAGRWWIFEYLFAKQDRSNIDHDELVEFRKLSKTYAELDETQLAQLVSNNHLVEICHDNQI